MFAAGQPHTVRLFPITNYVKVHGVQYPFQVTPSGHVDYDHSLDAVLLGRDSSVLTIRRPRRNRPRASASR